MIISCRRQLSPLLLRIAACRLPPPAAIFAAIRLCSFMTPSDALCHAIISHTLILIFLFITAIFAAIAFAILIIATFSFFFFLAFAAAPFRRSLSYGFRFS